MSEVDFDLSVPGGSDPSAERCARVQSHQLPASEQSSAPGQSVAHGLNHRQEESDVDENFLNDLLEGGVGDPFDLSPGSSGGLEHLHSEQRLLPNAICGESKAMVSTKRLDSESMKLNGDELQNQPVVKKQRVDNEAKKVAAKNRNVEHFADCLQVFEKQFLHKILSQVTLGSGSTTLNQVISERDAEELIDSTCCVLTLAGYPLGQNTVERLRLGFKKCIGKSILSLISTLIATLGTAPEICACCTKANQNAINEWHDKCGEEFKKLGIELEKMPDSKTKKAKWVEKGFKKCREKLGLSEGDELPGWANSPTLTNGTLDKLKHKIYPVGGVYTEEDKKTPHDCPHCSTCFVKYEDAFPKEKCHCVSSV